MKHVIVVLLVCALPAGGTATRFCVAAPPGKGVYRPL
jgi:hypothetical protein